MKAAEEEQEEAPAECGKARVEDLSLRLVRRSRPLDPERRNSLLCPIEPEGLTRLAPFLFGSKDDGGGIAQQPIIRPRPVKPFLQVFERISSFEPRVEHPVR